ncbi:MAG TPA: endonuclease/exonuclease/phosphatase family protein, partial [Longimicrobium sp.]|nr:endonuclease/exonuclease/phosphatase family protein [Longimicrobium sp.]
YQWDAGPTRDAGYEWDAGPQPTWDGGYDWDAGPQPTYDGGSEWDAGPQPTWDAGYEWDAGPQPTWDAGSPGDAGTDGGTSTDGGTDGGTPPTGSTLIRLMAANTTSGNGQNYDPGHGIRIFQGTRPDVVMIQEFNYTGGIRQFVDTAFGPEFHYYREEGAQIPNGVISRWPILAAGEWDDPRVTNRDFAWARIDVPGPKDLWVVSVHLLTASSTERNLEANSLVNFINANVPPGDYLAIGGDFNTDSRSEPCLSTFSSVVATVGPHPADRNGNTNTNATRAKPYDHLLVDGDLRQYQVDTVIGTSTFFGGLVVDTRVYSPLWEIAPAQQGDSGAPSMQHMAVIKDFLIPGGAATASITVGSPNGGESWVGGSTHSITWASTGVTNVALEYTLDGSGWTTITPSTAASAGSYTWTVPNLAASAAMVRVSDTFNPGLSDTSNAAFTITVSGGADGGIADGGVADGGVADGGVADGGVGDGGIGGGDGGTGLVFLNEVLINEPGTDVNGEFVELVNAGSSEVDISGWTISDAV